MNVELNWEDDGVYRKFNGRFSDSDVRQSNQRIVRDQRFGTARWCISDFLDAEIDEDEPRNFYDAVANHEAVMAGLRRGDSGLWTAAVASDPQTIAHLRFFHSLKLPPHPFELFETVDQAREWIAGHCPSAMR